MATLMPEGKQSFETAAGIPLVGGKVYTYDGGTNNPRPTYQDAAGTVPNTNPIILDARGEATIFWSGTYKIVLKDSLDNTIWTVDGAVDSASVSAALDALIRSDLSNQNNAAKNAALIGFNPTLNYVAGSVAGHLADQPLCPKDFPWLAKFDGVTDDAAAINACAAAALAGGKCMVMPTRGTALVKSTLDFSGLMVIGYGRGKIHIQAHTTQFDVMKTTGNTTLVGLYVHGGWDGATAGQSGDILSIVAVNPAYPYNIHLRDCTFQYAKKRGIYWERGGYSSAWNVKINACGLHGCELFGNNSADACTTVMIGGFSVFSDCPFGYGIKLTECINVSVVGAIMENTKGIGFGGIGNRSLLFHGVYQENTSGLKFADWSASSGIGIEFRGCFGGGAGIDYNVNWLNQAYSGNSLLSEPAIPIDGYRIILVDGGEQTTAAAGSFTAATVSVPPGTWLATAYVQTLNSAGGTLTQLGAVLTTNNAASGINTATNVLNSGSDEQTFNPGANGDLRCNIVDVIQNTTSANVNWYVRTFINRTAGTIAYRGAIKLTRIT